LNRIVSRRVKKWVVLTKQTPSSYEASFDDSDCVRTLWSVQYVWSLRAYDVWTLWLMTLTCGVHD